MKNLLKNVFIKFSKVTIVHSTPGRIRLQVPGLNRIPDEYHYLGDELIELVKLLPTVTDLSICFITSRALLHFNNNEIDENKLVDWFNMVWKTITVQFSNREDINDTDELITLIREEILSHIKEFSNVHEP